MTGSVAGSAETVSDVLRRFFAAERVASEDGFLQRRDPRVALLSVAGLALAAMIARTFAAALPLAGVAALLAWRSSVPPKRFLARSGVVPLASSATVLPQAALMPGEVLAGAFGLAVTDAGVAYVVLFTLRLWIGVSLLSLLVMTTPFSALVAAMRDLRVPVALVWVIAITYRYLFLFFDELRRLILARNGRTAGETGVRAGWSDARRIAGTFLLRTLDRGERVGRGMRARGGTRSPSPYGRSRSIDAGDCALAAVALAAVVGSGVLRWVA